MQPIRGTHDLLPKEKALHDFIDQTAHQVSGLYGYSAVATPILEFNQVFNRTLGETSDVVSKEMYTFEDRNGELITLRPEGTAPLARALISNKLTQELPQKFYTCGPMFRYERPQKGRQRQFHQISVELFGVEEPEGDVEVIALAAHVLKSLGVLDKTTLFLNTLGDQESRQAYRQALVTYFQSHQSSLSVDSQSRLEKNPLRILDSKDPGDQALVKNAPLSAPYLTDFSRKFFHTVCEGLTQLGISFIVDPRIVRGLDYYCHTTFEFITQELGAQGTVLAGGRYNGLVKTLGGPDIPGIGWAGGMERLALLLPSQPSSPRPLAIVPMDESAQAHARKLAHDLRHAGFPVELAYGGNGGKRLKRAHKVGASRALILGSQEMERGEILVRHMDSGEQESIPQSNLISYLTSL
jgi:histidyl-tRNA synthetase